MPLLLALLSIAAVLAIAVAVIIITRRTTINVIIRKDPDMASIKQRLAALEAANTRMAAQLAEHDQTITESASSEKVDALASRVEVIESEIGTDPEPTADPAPAPVTTADATAIGG